MPTRTVKISERLYQRAAQHADELGISICDSLDRLASDGDQKESDQDDKSLDIWTQFEELDEELEQQGEAIEGVRRNLIEIFIGLNLGQQLIARALNLDTDEFLKEVNQAVEQHNNATQSQI